MIYIYIYIDMYLSLSLSIYIYIYRYYYIMSVGRVIWECGESVDRVAVPRRGDPRRGHPEKEHATRKGFDPSLLSEDGCHMYTFATAPLKGGSEKGGSEKGGFLSDRTVYV